MNYKLCIFDLDGTLTDTINSIAYFANNALNKFGYGSIPVEKYKILVGEGAKKLINDCVEFLGGGDNQTNEEILKYYSQTYNADFLFKTVVYDGIFDLLEFLKQSEISMAVLSNKPNDTTVKIIEELFPKNTFDIYFGGREGVPLKPDKTAVLEIVEKLGYKKEECLYIGDTATDMKTGKNAGIATIGVLWGFRDYEELKENNADLIVSKPMEIAEFIKSNKKI